MKSWAVCLRALPVAHLCGTVQMGACRQGFVLGGGMGGSEALKTEIVVRSRYPTPQVGNITLAAAHCTPLSLGTRGKGNFCRNALRVGEPWPTKLDRGDKIRFKNGW